MNRLLRSILTVTGLKWAGIAAISLGLMLAVWILILDATGAPRRYFARYVAYLDRKLRLLFIWTSADRIAIAQLAAMLVVAATAVFTDLPLWYAIIAAIAAGPPLYIEWLRKRRVAAIEAQLDGFILAMANALRVTPSIGDAFISVQSLTRPPLRQEIELAIKEMRVGSTLDQALRLMASRIGSRQVDSAFSALLIGRQVGGNVPKILDATAGTLREIARLEAVVRTKTAEGKAQLALLSVFPFFLIVGFSMVKEHYFDPLTQSFTGYVIIGVAGLSWVGSLVWARRIVAVDV